VICSAAAAGNLVAEAAAVTETASGRSALSDIVGIAGFAAFFRLSLVCWTLQALSVALLPVACGGRARRRR